MLTRLLGTLVLTTMLALIATPSAYAGTYDLGTLSSTYSYSDVIYHKPSNKKFSDIFTFTVPENYTADISAVISNLKILGPLFQLKKLAFAGIDGVLADTGSNQTHLSYSDLAAGDYAFGVSGKSAGLFGGFYRLKLSASLSPVPEPATIAMLLAGLGLVVTTARRRAGSR